MYVVLVIVKFVLDLIWEKSVYVTTIMIVYNTPRRFQFM